MRASSIDTKKLDELCNAIRGQESLPIKVRRQLVETLLKECDIIRQTDIERLICIGCAAELAGMTRAGMQRHADKRLHVYRLCHKRNRELREYGAFLDRREVQEVIEQRNSVVKTTRRS